MKKITLIILSVLMFVGAFACAPENFTDDSNDKQEFRYNLFKTSVEIGTNGNKRSKQNIENLLFIGDNKIIKWNGCYKANTYDIHLLKDGKFFREIASNINGYEYKWKIDIDITGGDFEIAILPNFNIKRNISNDDRLGEKTNSLMIEVSPVQKAFWKVYTFHRSESISKQREKLYMYFSTFANSMLHKRALKGTTEKGLYDPMEIIKFPTIPIKLLMRLIATDEEIAEMYYNATECEDIEEFLKTLEFDDVYSPVKVKALLAILEKEFGFSITDQSVVNNNNGSVTLNLILRNNNTQSSIKMSITQVTDMKVLKRIVIDFYEPSNNQYKFRVEFIAKYTGVYEGEEFYGSDIYIVSKYIYENGKKIYEGVANYLGLTIGSQYFIFHNRFGDSYTPYEHKPRLGNYSYTIIDQEENAYNINVSSDYIIKLIASYKSWYQNFILNI